MAIKFSPTGSTAVATPTPQTSGKFLPNQPQGDQANKPGLFQGMVQDILSPFLSAGVTAYKGGESLVKTAKAGYQQLTGDQAGFQKTAAEITNPDNFTKPVDLGYFGKVKPEYIEPGFTKKAASQAIHAAGTGAELGSYLVGAGSLEKAGEGVAKKAVGQAIKESALAGTEIGGIGGFGSSLKSQTEEGGLPTLGKTALDTAVGAAGGAALGAGGGLLAESARMLRTGAADAAPKFINSLIKPLAKDFSFGKNPGRAVAEEGITANSFNDLETKIGDKLKSIGTQIGTIISGSNKKINISDTLKPIQDALDNANKAPQTNAALITRLQGVLSDIRGSWAPGRTVGVIPAQAFQMKDLVADLTKWTDARTDDNVVNKALKQVYGNIKDKINTAVEDPNLAKLNEKYADLKSAQIATRWRDKIEQRANLISMPIKAGGTAGLIVSLATGGLTVPAFLAAIGVGTVDKLLSSPAAKTRIASALEKFGEKETPTIVEALIQKIPQLAGVIKQ